MDNRWRIPTARTSNDPRFTNRNANHTVPYGSKGICKVCGEPIGRGHDAEACADEWIRRQDQELTTREERKP